MRLIDADALKIHDVSPCYGYSIDGVTDGDIEDAPTIDAIPVNWIIKWNAEHMEDYGTITISKMLEDWKNDKANRKE